MSKGLDALKHLYNEYILTEYPDSILKDIDKDKETIEKELKQAEESEKLLNVFKNALTIEYHDYPMVELDHSKDVVSSFVKELYTIRQSELDKDMRKALKEWVLKNAFPKEIKALEIIKKYPQNRNSLQNFRFMIEYWEKNNIEVTKELLETYDFPFEIDEYNLLKEELL